MALLSVGDSEVETTGSEILNLPFARDP